MNLNEFTNEPKAAITGGGIDTSEILRETIEKKPTELRDKVFFFCYYVLLFFYFHFVFEARFCLGITVFLAATFLLSGAYLIPKRELKVFPILCGLFGLILSFSFVIGRDNSINSIVFIAVLCLYTLFIGGVSGELAKGGATFSTIGEIFKIFVIYPFTYILHPYTLKKSHEPKVSFNTAAKLFFGAFICLPVLFIVIPFLINSDAAFEGFVDGLFDKIGGLIASLIYALLLLPLVISRNFALRITKGAKERKTEEGKRFEIDPVIAYGFFGILSLCYLAYLFSQLAYFFSGFMGILPEGYDFTNAEYARRGFFEMCTISFINLSIIFFAVIRVKRRDDGRLPALAVIFASFISLFSLVMIFTAESKMFLYIESYGLTRLRLLTSLFMVLLIFAFVFAFILAVKRSFPYFRYITVAVTVFVMLISFMNINGFVADYNVSQYLSHKHDAVDTHYLRTLGDAAVPALERLYKEGDHEASEDARKALVILYTRWDIYREDDSNFFDYTVAGARADKIFEAHPELGGTKMTEGADYGY